MSIRIIGQLAGREREAAEDLAHRLAPIFDKKANVTIIAGAKCYGEARQDIDLLVFANFPQGAPIKASLLPEIFSKHRTYLSSMLVTLEVKDHGPEDIRIIGNQVEVRYREHWSNASAQAHEQTYSVRNYMIRSLGRSPWIISGLWLRNMATANFPGAPHNLLGSDLDGDRFLKFVAQNRHETLAWQLQQGRNDLYISAIKKSDAELFRDSLDLFTKTLAKGSLDRRKLELVCQNILKDQQYADRFGTQLLLFRGRGGSGKTLRLLQIARTLHETKGDRILLLTYNKALVSDIRRLLSILGITDKIDDRTISIRSSDSFFFGLLKAYGLAPSHGPENEFPTDYVQKKDELLQFLRTSNSDVLMNERTAVDNPEYFAWDFVLIDEGQDWPEEERDILFALFGPEHLIVADGVDQFVREQGRCDWMKGVSNRQIVTLKKSLRLKKNLCRMATAFAEDCGIEWDMEPNDDIVGGRVKLLLGPYNREVHLKIMAAHNRAGNKPIDALFCLTGAPGASSAQFAEQLTTWGFQVWDATTSEGRDRFPTSVEQHRLVKYESCRGLEGWTVVCLDFDQFFARQLNDRQYQDRELFVSPEQASLRFAARWCLIPLTRAIDTLVIQMQEQSALAHRLLGISKDYDDFVEIIRTQ